MLLKIGVLLLILAGESLVIYAEMIGARLYALHGASFGSAALSTLIPIIVGSFLLVCGYMLGTKQFGNIWVITVVSMASVLLVEPLFNLLYIGHTPTLGAGIGFILGALGIAATFLL